MFFYNTVVLESGIEVIRILKLQLPDNCWLSDGEIWPHADAPGAFLLRRPIILLDLAWLSEQFHADRSFGDAIVPQRQDEEDFVDCKRLRTIPPSGFHAFIDLKVDDLYGYDIDLRRARQRRIEAEWCSQGCGDVGLEAPPTMDPRTHLERIEALLRDRFSGDQLQSRASLAREWHQINSWMERWGPLLTAALRTGSLPEGPLTSLCPVTWKTLELGFQHGLF